MKGSGGPGAAGLYVHLPFCVVRCSYCDFYSLVGQEDLAAPYLDALLSELRAFPAREGSAATIGTIYVGGGTPSHLPRGSVSELLAAIGETFRVAEGAEVTVEANPESATRERLSEFRSAGANRLSLGVQSFQPGFLAMLGRPHGPESARLAVEEARRAGFDNVGLDLIYGLPGQDPVSWASDLESAVALGGEHLSAYLLETDKETPLARRLRSKELEEPDQQTISALYRMTEERLPELGFRRYEVSNWARSGKESRHNLGYWEDRPYFGFGSSAHSYYGGLRRACRLSATAYIAAVRAGEETREVLDDGAPETRLAEALVTALRLAAGADLDAIGGRYGVDLWRRHENDLRELEGRGWIVVDPPRVRLTVDGILWSGESLTPFVPSP